MGPYPSGVINERSVKTTLNVGNYHCSTNNFSFNPVKCVVVYLLRKLGLFKASKYFICTWIATTLKAKKKRQQKKEKTSPLPPPQKKNTHSGKIGIQNVFILYIQQTHRCVEGAVVYINVDMPKQTYAWC